MLYPHATEPPEPQGHPLYATDRSIVDRLLAAPTPQPQDIADCARLLIRHDGYPGCPDIQTDLHRVLDIWGITRKELNESARSLWHSGWRPISTDTTAEVGSGADVNAA